MEMRTALFLTLSFISLHSSAQIGNVDSLQINQIKAQNTDANISFELANHYTFYNPTATSQNLLLVYLPGSYDNPKNTIRFPSLAANYGIHVVSLKYENGVASKTACGNSSDSLCFDHFRKEILFGEDLSSEVTVDTTHSVINRLEKLLIYLATNEPGKGWGHFYTSNLQWDKIMVAGHSQGGGHAALLGITFNVNRVMMFSSPNDFNTNLNLPSNWLSNSKASSSDVFYGFNNLNDDVVEFSEQYAVWERLDFDTQNDTVNVDINLRPFLNSHKLYTTVSGGGVAHNHSATVRDDETPLDNSGNPIFQPVWEYMLGINETANKIEQYPIEKIKIFPNPSHSHVQIAGNVEEIRMYNLNGIQVAFPLIDHQDYDVSKLETGIYFLRIKTKKGYEIEPFIKSN